MPILKPPLSNIELNSKKFSHNRKVTGAPAELTKLGSAPYQREKSVDLAQDGQNGKVKSIAKDDG
jgi:hypothetical protein